MIAPVVTRRVSRVCKKWVRYESLEEPGYVIDRSVEAHLDATGVIPEPGHLVRFHQHCDDWDGSWYSYYPEDRPQ